MPCLNRLANSIPFFQEIIQSNVASANSDAIKALVEKKLAQGELVLLIDGLDQIDSESLASVRLRLLNRFLENAAANCHVIVASRPYAIQRYWNPVFRNDAWHFASLAPFSDAETRAYLGQRKYDAVQTLGSTIPAVPRSLALIDRISLEDISQFKSASEVYWAAVSTMLKRAFASHSAQRAGLDREDALWLLSALAFEMSLSGTSSITTSDIHDFQWRLWERRAKGNGL